MLEAYNQSDIAIEVMQTWVFFGDPTTVFRSQSPVALTATHPEIVAIEGGEISLGVNMTGATVTLTQDSLPLFSETIQNNSLYINLGALANDSVIKVTVTKPNTIPYQGEIMVNDPLSLVDFDKGWMIYPNPAREKIHLKNLGGFTDAVNIQLTDCNGRVLVQIPSISLGTDYSIPLPNLQTGLYLLSIENDSLRKTQKIIVK
jgi:gingipain R